MSSVDIYFSKRRLRISCLCEGLLLVVLGYFFLSEIVGVLTPIGQGLHPAWTPILLFGVAYTLYVFGRLLRCLKHEGPGITLNSSGLSVFPFNRCQPISWSDISSIQLRGTTKANFGFDAWWSLRIDSRAGGCVKIDAYFFGPQDRDTVIDWLNQFAPGAHRKGVPVAAPE